jgi:hypothetical protein
LTNTTPDELTEEVTAFIRKNLKPEMLLEIINAATTFPDTTQAKLDSITQAVAGVAGILLAIQKIEIQEDCIDGLQADLEEAVQVAYNRGAEDWARLNYPSWIDRLEANKRSAEERKTC